MSSGTGLVDTSTRYHQVRHVLKEHRATFALSETLAAHHDPAHPEQHNNLPRRELAHDLPPSSLLPSLSGWNGTPQGAPEAAQAATYRQRSCTEASAHAHQSLNLWKPESAPQLGCSSPRCTGGNFHGVKRSEEGSGRDAGEARRRGHALSGEKPSSAATKRSPSSSMGDGDARVGGEGEIEHHAGRSRATYAEGELAGVGPIIRANAGGKFPQDGTSAGRSRRILQRRRQIGASPRPPPGRRPHQGSWSTSMIG